jgi:ribulose-phosphate 3-epimerase
MDHLLVMSVNPGFGGQTFIPHSLAKIAAARDLLAASGSQAVIEVDGGVDRENAASIIRAGASILVAGASIFGTGDATEATRALRRAAGAAV